MNALPWIKEFHHMIVFNFTANVISNPPPTLKTLHYKLNRCFKIEELRYWIYTHSIYALPTVRPWSLIHCEKANTKTRSFSLVCNRSNTFRMNELYYTFAHLLLKLKTTINGNLHYFSLSFIIKKYAPRTTVDSFNPKHIWRALFLILISLL